tara:strand:- start:105 stop:299 length:195 start_codon:yes stop_codon:yes gene_type:complete
MGDTPDGLEETVVDCGPIITYSGLIEEWVDGDKFTSGDFVRCDSDPISESVLFSAIRIHEYTSA